MPLRLHGYLYLMAEIATIIFAVIAVRLSWHTMEQLWQFGAATPVLRVSRIWAEAAVPIGFTLVVIRSLQAARRDRFSIFHAGRGQDIGFWMQTADQPPKRPP